MKKQFGILLFLLFLSGLAWKYWNPTVETYQESAQSLSRLDKKHIPSDEFFMQRAFPDAAFSMKAYTEALQSVKTNIKAQPRNNFENFDRAWQVEGPGNLGARINTVAYHPDNTAIIIAGFSSGGLFRTENGGKDWSPVFDDQLFLAIGDIAFDPSNPNTVYAGTGDTNISGFPFLGDGLYKSEDAGLTWENIGLEETRIVSKIIVHPSNSDIVFVSTMGLPFEPTKDRGVYRTVDGGENWQQVLFLGEETGAIDVIFDTEDPTILYAAGWDRMRNSKVSKTHGDGAKIHRSADGGNTWHQLTHILPTEPQGRIGLAASQDAVFAIYVDSLHDHHNLYRSYDKGLSWAVIPVNESVRESLQGFGWYFGKVRVNPEDRDDITILGVYSNRTLDGGVTWEVLSRFTNISIHADHHDVVYHPSGKMLLATDGGLYESENKGMDWKDTENIPATQTYRVAFNPHLPDFYYGGFQDNGSAAGNADQINAWEKYNGGDGFTTIFHPTESDIFYSESQRGKIEVTRDGGVTWVTALNGLNFSDRRGWDMPYILSPHDPSVLYTGTHRMYKSTSGTIPNWEVISEDLTDGPIYDRPQSISTINQSIIDKTLYVGTMDANVWKSEDEGVSWESIQRQLPERAVTDMVASPDDENTVFVTYSGYKDNDFSPHIFRSDDKGASWYSIAGNLPALAINALVVAEGYDNQVLFVGTDGGVFGSLNGGEQWERLGTNMPIVAVYDLVWNTGINTLVAGTFARSILSYSLDEIIEPPSNTLSSVSDIGNTEAPLLLFPNPVANQLSLSFSDKVANETVWVELYNIQGQLVQSFNTRIGQGALIQKDVSTFATGTYLINITGEQFYFSGQFIKMNL